MKVFKQLKLLLTVRSLFWKRFVNLRIHLQRGLEFVLTAPTYMGRKKTTLFQNWYILCIEQNHCYSKGK
jgi:hypothetical protein